MSISTYLPSMVSGIGAAIAISAAFWKAERESVAVQSGQPVSTRKMSRLLAVGAVMALIGTLLSDSSKIVSSARQSKLQDELLAKSRELLSLNDKLNGKSEELLSLSARISGKSDEIGSLSHRLLAKNEEIVSLSRKLGAKSEEIISRDRQLAAKSEEIITLNRQLAAKSEENSEIRKRDLETREITVEQLIRSIASECVNNNPELQKKLESIHNHFERGLTETLSTSDSVSTDATKKKAPEPPQQ